jgi:tripartite-type tricarboxylate transporter receptor subunit TctC
LEQLINPSYAVNPTLYSKVPHEFEKDFNLVSLAVLTTLVIVVHPSVPAHTVNDPVGLIKANPGRCSYASPGTGTPGHLVGETFRLSQALTSFMTIVTGRVLVMALARRAICEGPYGMQNPGGSHDFQRTNTLHKP